MKEKIELITKNLSNIKKEYFAVCYGFSRVFVEVENVNNTLMFEEIFNRLSLISNRTIFKDLNEEIFVFSRLDEILILLESFHRFNGSIAYLLNAENENYYKFYMQNYKNQTLDFLYKISNEFNFIELLLNENKLVVIEKIKDIDVKRANLLDDITNNAPTSLVDSEIKMRTLYKKISYLTEQIHEINEYQYGKNRIRKSTRRKSSYRGIRLTRCPIESSASLLPYQRNSPSIKEDFKTFKANF